MKATTPFTAGRARDPRRRRRRRAPGQTGPPSDGVGRREVEAALRGLDLALCRDRCHAVVAAPAGPGKKLLLGALAERLPTGLEVVQLRARSGDPCAQVLRDLGEAPGADAGAQLLGVLHELTERGAALVLLVGDAQSLAKQDLRRLGQLASAAAPGLRLALVVEERSGRDTVAEVVSALGVGVEKVVLYGRTPKPPVARLRPAPAPAAANPSGSAVPVPAPARPESLPPLQAAAGSEITPEVRSALRSVGILALTLGVAGIFWIYESKLAERGRAEPARDVVVAPVPAQPAPPELAAPVVAPIRVSLNAEPWARIEVDGRDVGATPLADLQLAPGPHRFRAHFPDGRIVERELQVDEQQHRFSFP